MEELDHISPHMEALFGCSNNRTFIIGFSKRLFIICGALITKLGFQFSIDHLILKAYIFLFFWFLPLQIHVEHGAVPDPVAQQEQLTGFRII